MDLSRLAQPFPADDVEWRVSRCGMGERGIYCWVLAYITARAIQERLDEVCGIGGWKNTPPASLPLGDGSVGISTGISIVVGGEWVTKYDMAEPTSIHPAKGGFSGAEKRAGSQWGIGRYLYHLSETFAEVSEHRPSESTTWNYARLPADEGRRIFYWKTPKLPGWALPKDPDQAIGLDDLNKLKKDWKAKFAPDVSDPAALRDGFRLFVVAAAGEFPVEDHTCWTQGFLESCLARISDTSVPGGIDPDVPFGE